MLSAVVLLLLSILSLASHQSLSYAAPTTNDPCPPYEAFSKSRSNKHLSQGRHQLPLQRPAERCRKFPSPALEKTIVRLRDKVADPDLFRLFQNSYPNTLDTAVLWTGFAARDTSAPESSDVSDEDLAFVITGDMYVH